VKQVGAILKRHNAYGGLFCEIGEHAPVAGLRKAQQTFKDTDRDMIVSFGGSSPINSAKAILYNLQREGGGPTLKQIAIPITLSAAECMIRYPLLFSQIGTYNCAEYLARGWSHR
jgi:alcohol dehydrogenase class IV